MYRKDQPNWKTRTKSEKLTWPSAVPLLDYDEAVGFDDFTGWMRAVFRDPIVRLALRQLTYDLQRRLVSYTWAELWNEMMYELGYQRVSEHLR